MKNLTLCALLALAPLACLADDATPFLNVKTGLWEDTVSTQTSGMPSIPEDVLAKMPPERRAQIEAMMKNGMAAHTVKSCVTPDMLRKATFYEDRSNACTRTVKASSASSVDFHMECNMGHGKTVADGHFAASDAENFKGEVTGVTTTQDGRTIPSKTTITGHWLSSDCGNLQPK